MHLATKTGNSKATARRRRQLAAMPTIWVNARVMRQAANRVFNRIQSKSRVQAPPIGINVAGWTPPITRVFDSHLNTIAILAG